MGEFSPKGQGDEHDGDAMRRFILRRADRGAQSVRIKPDRGRKVGYGNGNVVEATDHGQSSVLAAVMGVRIAQIKGGVLESGADGVGAGAALT
jgi:hypothetical protein